MRLYASRDSVAAGDDFDAPHGALFSFGEGTSVLAAVESIVASGYLPCVAGGKATWSVTSDVPIAVVAQEWTTPRAIVRKAPVVEDLAQRDGFPWIHFAYHGQRDPEVVCQELASKLGAV